MQSTNHDDLPQGYEDRDEQKRRNQILPGQEKEEQNRDQNQCGCGRGDRRVSSSAPESEKLVSRCVDILSHRCRLSLSFREATLQSLRGAGSKDRPTAKSYYILTPKTH
jgi:hypothetical protein